MTIHLFDVLVTLATALDLVQGSMYTHHHRVAYICFRIGEKMGMDKDTMQNLVFSALIHDLGVITKREKESLLDFYVGDVNSHVSRGYNFLSESRVLRPLSLPVKYHHTFYEKRDDIMPHISSVLHLADRVEVIINDDGDIFEQMQNIMKRIEKRSGTMFDPAVVHAFKAVAGDMNFWQILKSPNIFEWISRRFRGQEDMLSKEEIEDVCYSIAKMVDFRSKFMYAHSTNVARISEILSREIFNGDEEMAYELKIAGFLHDMGKLVIPEETIDKGNPLTGAEKTLIHTHPFYTNVLLKQIKGLGNIVEYASYHHERLNGKGYPFHVEEERFKTPHQIVALSDILAALNEDRAYRLKKNRNYISGVLENCSRTGMFAPEVLNAAENKIREIIESAAENSVKMLNEYVRWSRGV